MKNISLIGAGAVGRSIALALFYSGVQLSGVHSKNGFSAINIGKRVKAKKYGTLETFNEKPRVIIIATKDSEIRSVAKFIYHQFPSLSGVTVIHTSGALTSGELKILKQKGASVGSFHPLQTFPKKNITGKEFKDIWVAVEGDKKAITTCKRIASTVKANHFPVSAKDKILYHTAGVFASNYLVTLLSVVEKIAIKVKISQKDIWKIFLPILVKTIENVITTSPKDSITGVIERGDVAMVKKHLHSLQQHKLSHIAPLYAVLGMETVRLVKEKNAR